MNYDILPPDKKLKTYMDNAAANGLPKDAYLQVTERCNCKCVMCGIWENPSPISGDPKTLKSIIQTLGREHFDWVTLWGGEPYLHPQIVQIMEEVKNQGMNLQLITNGTLLRGPKLSATADLADNVVFSVDASSPEVHDQIRGVKGTFARVMENMHALASLVSRKGKGPSMEIDTTILTFNMDELQKMLEIGKQFGGILVDFDPAQINGTGNAANRSIIDIPENVIVRTFEQLICQAQNGAHISSAPKLELMRDYLLGIDLIGPCMSIFKDMLIAPDGKVYFCWGWDKVVGNILEDDFKGKWEQSIKHNQDAIDGNMDRCKKCGFSHVRWPDIGAAEKITEANRLRRKYFESQTAG